MPVSPHQESNEDRQASIAWLATASREEMRDIVEALYRVHRLNAALTDLDTLLLRIAEESRHVAHAEASSLLLHDSERNDLYFHVAVGESGDQELLKREIRLQYGQGIAGTVAETRASINVQDAREDARVYREADELANFQTRNLLAVPMLDRDQLVGVLEVVNKRGEAAFSPRDMHIMEMFSNLAAAAILNARLIEEQLRNERLAAVGQAVTALAHHTKNIVSGLSSSAELIDLGLESGNVEVLRKSWPVFKRSTRRISDFVQDMLAFSKQRQPIREECRLEEVLRDALETMNDLFRRKGAEVDTDIARAGGTLYLDSQGIYRCLLNLLNNAAEVVPDQGGRVRITAWIGDNLNLELEVADNGPGIPREDRERIFEPFYSTKGYKGTGLGLAVTKKTIEEHGGFISVADAPEGGALFYIMLPAGQPSFARR